MCLRDSNNLILRFANRSLCEIARNINLRHLENANIIDKGIKYEYTKFASSSKISAFYREICFIDVMLSFLINA